MNTLEIVTHAISLQSKLAGSEADAVAIAGFLEASELVRHNSGEHSRFYKKIIETEELKSIWSYKKKILIEILEGYVRHINYGLFRQISEKESKAFINPERIEALSKLESQNYDFRKLIKLCQEINSCYINGSYFSVSMLVRSILDHIPPIFGCKTFSEVSNNYSGGGKSFKDAMEYLDKFSRKLADMGLHYRIRSTETVPTSDQVFCGPQLDLLLGELVRICK